MTFQITSLTFLLNWNQPYYARYWNLTSMLAWKSIRHWVVFSKIRCLMQCAIVRNFFYCNSHLKETRVRQDEDYWAVIDLEVLQATLEGEVHYTFYGLWPSVRPSAFAFILLLAIHQGLQSHELQGASSQIDRKHPVWLDFRFVGLSAPTVLLWAL